MFQSTRPDLSIKNVTAVMPPGFDSSVATSNYTEDPEIARLREQHPLYSEMLSEWNLYLAAYEGGPAMANVSNLFRHRRENEDDFAERGKRLHYQNYCQELVDFFTNFIFTETIHRDGGDDQAFYADFIKNVDLKGSNISEFMSEVSDQTQIFGHLYIMVDTPRVNLQDGEIITQADQDAMDMRQYWLIIPPTEIISWHVDSFENLEYIKRMQCISQLDKNLKLGSYEKFTEVTPDEVKISIVNVSDPKEPKIISQDTFKNSFGYIPIEVARHKRSKRVPFMGLSFLRDFAYNNREVMNLTSLLQEFLYRQCFNFLAIETDETVPFRDQLDGEFGPANVIQHPKGTETPAYVTPPVEPAQFIQSERSKLVGEMFKLAAQDAMNELMNGEKSSGFSQAQSFSKTVPFISTRADNLENIENALMDITMKMVGKKWTGRIKYKDRYELTNITDAMTQLLMLFRDLQLPSPTFLKEELKRFVSEYDGKLQPDTLQKIMAEIDAIDFDEWQETQKEALVGNSGSSPGDQQGDKSTNTMSEVAAESRSANTGATKKVRNKKNK